MLRMEYCRSGLQTHRGNAIVDTPCQSPSEFAILLPNNSIPVVAPRCSKTYIIQLKACIKPDPGTWQPGQWVHPSLESILKASFQKGVSSMRHENCSLHDVWWLRHTLDKYRMTKQMDTPEDDSHGIIIVALDCRPTEAMQPLTHLAKALQSLRSCCQTIQYQLSLYQNMNKQPCVVW